MKGWLALFLDGTTAAIIQAYNPGHNISELYNILVQISFTTSKWKLDM